MSETLTRITKIKKIILWSIIIGGLIALFIPTFVHGAEPLNVCDLGGRNCLQGTENLANNGADSNTVVKLLITIAQWLTFVSAAVSVLFGVWAGITIMTASGDDSKYKNGIKTLQYAVIGLVITIVAYTVVAIIARIVSGQVIS